MMLNVLMPIGALAGGGAFVLLTIAGADLITRKKCQKKS